MNLFLLKKITDKIILMVNNYDGGAMSGINFYNLIALYNFSTLMQIELFPSKLLKAKGLFHQLSNFYELFEMWPSYNSYQSEVRVILDHRKQGETHPLSIRF